jgi:acetyl-CoA acetyltransferase
MPHQYRPSFLGRTAIAGVGFTEFSRESGRTVLDLALEATQNLFADTGVSERDIDGIVSYGLLGDSEPSQALATALGVPKLRFIVDANMGGQAPCHMVSHAAMAIETGVADYVLIFRALNGRSGIRVGRGNFSGIGVQHRYPIGLTAYPQYFALWAKRYLDETGQTESALAAVSIAQRKYSARNPRAAVRSLLDLDAYFDAPLVAEPFRTPDCTREVDGACAILVTSLERAHDLKQVPIVIEGSAYTGGNRMGLDIGDVLSWSDYTRNFSTHLAADLWASAGMGPDDIDIAQIYDCFSIAVLMGLEGLGFCSRGESADFISAGETATDGTLPTNTNGGLLSEGYVHGMNTVVEAVLQLQGRATRERQIENAMTAVVTSGGLAEGSALVLRRDSR